MEGYRDPQGCRTQFFAYLIAIVLTIVLCLVLHGCKTPYVAGTDTETNIRVNDRDVPVVTPADSASILALLECDSLNRVIMRQLEIERGRRITPTLKPVYLPAATPEQKPQLQLQFDCKEDSLLQIIHVQDSIIEHLRTERPTPVVIKEKGFVYYAGVAFIILVCLLALYGIAKLVLKFYGINI